MPPRLPGRRMGVAFVTCPMEVAQRLSARGSVRPGFAWAKVKLAQPKPRRCYRCLQTGHIGQRCTSEVNRGDRCFRCGSKGHLAKECTGTIRCPLCMDLGGQATHRLGAPGCGGASSVRSKPRGDPTMPPGRPPCNGEQEEQPGDNPGDGDASDGGDTLIMSPQREAAKEESRVSRSFLARKIPARDIAEGKGEKSSSQRGLEKGSPPLPKRSRRKAE
ncbi:PREDICTED: uncharacterized protein LOC105567555 [Vollenhovia emeryi]|uniref:uncharacterized protein LOC105567555 n=1 Tax=Vollenhovia emeryi TaxID=411798 RepID=UPI0005F423B6|nr:PREDICTED: uncharacterized protein LOC105567555 [Vollenhovia emeryi]